MMMMMMMMMMCYTGTSTVKMLRERFQGLFVLVFLAFSLVIAQAEPADDAEPLSADESMAEELVPASLPGK